MRIANLLSRLLPGALCLCLGAASGQEFIFEKAPFASCHASTVLPLKNGDVLAAWFGGTREGAADVAIWGARRTATGWDAPVELAREANIASYNPVLFYTADGKLWLYYKYGSHPNGWTAARRFSTDEGKTWSKVEHLPAGLYGPIRAKPLVLADGTVVSGTSVESYHSWACWIERSTDNGRTWTKAGPIVVDKSGAGTGTTVAPAEVQGTSDWDLTEGIIQPSVVKLSNGHLRLYARSTSRTGKICIADSKDQGRTWTQARPIELPNPNSGIDAVALPDGRVVLVYNHTPKGRTPLNLAVSRDGEHFRMFRVLEQEPGEYSYPAMVLGSDNALYLTYTWKRERIRYWRIPLNEIPKE